MRLGGKKSQMGNNIDFLTIGLRALSLALLKMLDFS